MRAGYLELWALGGHPGEADHGITHHIEIATPLPPAYLHHHRHVQTLTYQKPLRLINHTLAHPRDLHSAHVRPPFPPKRAPTTSKPAIDPSYLFQTPDIHTRHNGVKEEGSSQGIAALAGSVEQMVTNNRSSSSVTAGLARLA